MKRSQNPRAIFDVAITAASTLSDNVGVLCVILSGLRVFCVTRGVAFCLQSNKHVSDGIYENRTDKFHVRILTLRTWYN